MCYIIGKLIVFVDVLILHYINTLVYFVPQDREVRHGVEKIGQFFYRIEKNSFIMTMRKSFFNIVPVVLAGAICLMLSTLPISPYQEFIHGFYGGIICNVLSAIHTYTLDAISLYLLISISITFSRRRYRRNEMVYLASAVSAYLLFVCNGADKPSLDIFKPEYALSAIVVASTTSLIVEGVLHSGAIDNNANKNRFGSKVIAQLIKLIAVLAVYALAGAALGSRFEGNGIQNFFGWLASMAFSNLGRNILSGVLCSISINLLWFFGIHGNHALYEPFAFIFPEAKEVGHLASPILNKTFFDVFVAIGGTGMCLSLVIALLIFSKNKNNRGIAVTALLPSLFNISEPVVLGLPIIFNPIFLIPFCLAPVASMLIAYIAVGTGIVPMPLNPVEWTTPPLMGGYVSTGSVMGAVLQLVNIAVGALIYAPFIRLMERPKMDLINKYMPEIIAKVNESEKEGKATEFLASGTNLGIVADRLLTDMHNAINNDDIMLFYQPQMDENEHIVGVEALLRWKHPVAGYLYPPLVIHLAYEDESLYALTLKLIEEAASVLAELTKKGARRFKMSVNISPLQLQNKSFCDDVREIVSGFDFGSNFLAFEITERVALTATPLVDESIHKLKDMGIDIIMDDFGMGHSSISYLQNNKFNYVKIDGELVKHIMDNERSCNIIEMVCNLSERLDFDVIAEYVETKEQRDKLLEMGCHLYQGYLYSPAVPFDKLVEYMQKYNAFGNKAK